MNTDGASSTDLEAAEPKKRCRTCGDIWGDLPDNHHFRWIRWDQFRRHVDYGCCGSRRGEPALTVEMIPDGSFGSWIFFDVDDTKTKNIDLAPSSCHLKLQLRIRWKGAISVIILIKE